MYIPSYSGGRGRFNDTKRAAFTSQDIRFTNRGDTLYAIALAWPDNGHVTIGSLATDAALFQHAIEKVELLGVKEPLHWSRDRNGLVIEVPTHKPCDYAFVFQITPEKPAPNET